MAQLKQRYDSLRPLALADWAAEAGMDKLAFAKAMAAPRTRYVYELQRDVVVDVLLEAFESATAARR